MWPEPLFAIHVFFLLWEWSELSALMKYARSKLCGHIVLQGLGFLDICGEISAIEKPQ